MLSIRSTAAMTRALNLPLDPILRALLLRRMSQLTEYEHHDLRELANFLIVQEGDTAAQESNRFNPIAATSCPRRPVTLGE